ncbi:MAG: DNA polymerase IV [Candidatus Dormibacteraeota bacterium]|nr:DNA polymerase IV [Candidatus Dormibacteraeota bacterium]
MGGARSILHVDLDAFFVSCELLRRPELTGLPVVVAGGAEFHPGEPRRPGRAVVSAASYEARSFGVRSALPLSAALRQCPELVVLPVDIAYYAALSKQVFAVFRDYTPLVEPGSLDEAYLDVGGSRLLAGDGPSIAATIQRRLISELGLPCSVGIATCKTAAKVASDLHKPRGLVVVPPGGEAEFLAPLPLERLPGAGPKTVERLRLLGVRKIGDLARLDHPSLLAALGSQGAQLQARARGHDPSPVVPPGLPRSISRERTFEVDLTSLDEAQRMVRQMAFAVAGRLRAQGLLAGTVILKVRFQDFRTVTRQQALAAPTCLDLQLSRSARELLEPVYEPGVRLLGVGAGRLQEGEVAGLFPTDESRAARLDQALDRLRAQFGAQAITRGVGDAGRVSDWNRDHLRALGDPPSSAGEPPYHRAVEFEDRRPGLGDRARGPAGRGAGGR